MSDKSYNSLFIPLEVVQREYTGKLLVAVEAASRGLPVFIGHKASVFKLIKRAKSPGIVFQKGARGKNDKSNIFDMIKDKRFAIVAQDEEAGIVFSDFADFYNKRTVFQYLDELDYLYCWGDDDYNFIKDKEKNISKVKFTKMGSPRTCFWGHLGYEFYQKEIAEIKKKYGNYVLFASNFAFSNTYLPQEYVNNRLTNYPDFDDNKKQLLQQQFNFEQDLLDLFVEAIKYLSLKTDKNIIIRPHPMEKISTWQQKLKGIKKVFVIGDGDINPWILSSDVLVQNGCTSAIEAASSNVPVVALGEKEEDLFAIKNNIPNMLAMPAYDLDCLVDIVNNPLEHWQKNEAERKKLLDKKILGSGTLSPLHNIVDNIMELAGDFNADTAECLGRDSILYDLYEIYRLSKFRKNTVSSAMDKKKRQKIKKSKIKEDVLRLSKILNHKKELEVSRVAPNCYRIR